MASVNRVILVGRIGRDPEIRHTQSGQTVASLSVATDESYKDKQGNKVEAVEWHNVTAWGKTADFIGSYLGKGRLVYIEGKLKTEKYTDKQGVEKYTTKIIAERVQGLDKRPDGQQQAAQPQGYTGRQEYSTADMGDCPF
jgi:single-strand DNA-binding protein